MLEEVAEMVGDDAHQMRDTCRIKVAYQKLQSYRPAPAADTVPLRVAVHKNHRDNVWDTEALGPDERPARDDDAVWKLHAIITAHVPASPPAVPVIEGECE